jgi:hypothetical protein
MAEIPVSDQKARKPGQANAMQPAEELVSAISGVGIFIAWGYRNAWFVRRIIGGLASLTHPTSYCGLF